MKMDIHVFGHDLTFSYKRTLLGGCGSWPGTPWSEEYYEDVDLIIDNKIHVKLDKFTWVNEGYDSDGFYCIPEGALDFLELLEDHFCSAWSSKGCVYPDWYGHVECQNDARKCNRTIKEVK
ncbi:TPA_asm: hypothetical protein vir520_00038 [Caudoviricetes sp. vir520]|nr:TPA_asm: hypothetical protein vir520_00038 [Caudoviricetes sp. vir520]